MSLPTTAADRKAIPIITGLFDYFPDACAAIAELSRIGNEQHNPGEKLHWAREKSTDHADCIGRHLMERGTLDTDGQRHSAKVAWRALALLQTEIEAARTTTPFPPPLTSRADASAVCVVARPGESEIDATVRSLREAEFPVDMDRLARSKTTRHGGQLVEVKKRVGESMNEALLRTWRENCTTTPDMKWGFTVGDIVEVKGYSIPRLRGVVTGFDSRYIRCDMGRDNPKEGWSPASLKKVTPGLGSFATLEPGETPTQFILRCAHGNSK